MAKISAEMKRFFEEQRDPKMVSIGTASKGGVPNVCSKGLFLKLVDDETLVYADVYSLKTLENLGQNPRVAVAVIDSKTYKGYQFKGRAEILKEGPLVEEAKKLNLPQLQSVTRVTIEEVYSMDFGPDSGKRLI